MSDAELLSRHRAVIPSWIALLYDQPIEICSGRGRRVTDGEGRSYLDFFGGILTNSIGYDVAEISDAVRRQVDSGIVHTSTLYLIRSQVELAEKIARLSGIPDAKVFFCNSGSEANDTALTLATNHRGSQQVLAMRNSYHGRGFGPLAVTGNRGWSATPLTPFRVAYVEGGYRYRSPYRHLDDATYIAACVDDLRRTVATTTSGEIACLLAEPIQGVGGFTSGPDGLLGALAEVVAEHGGLFVSDEVQTGWGRTGDHFWGFQAHGVEPDLITFAKGLGNGLAIGGVVGRGDVMEAVTTSSISTFGGNPLATTAAGATLDYLLDHDLQANAAKLGDRLLSGLRDLADAHPVIGDVRGRGLMLAIELVVPGAEDPDPVAAGRLLEETRERGLLVGKGGLHGNVIRMAPAMTVTDDEAGEALDVLAASLDAVG
ncbi:MAG TPA: aspartate aminotransferase family protein [Acidimicrobiales bacterium]|nr:aspartate aminotransferase family protein [Acidimicrobiales bacterium]